MPSPKPIPATFKCSVCSLNWDRHDKNPTVEGCIALLKEDIVQARKSREFQVGSAKIHPLKEVREAS